jgi:hypothetical protein
VASVVLPGDRSTAERARSVALAVLAALALAFVISVAGAHGSATVAGRLGGDYPAFYGAGTLVRTGQASHLYDPGRQAAAERSLFGDERDGGYLDFAYPPAFAALYAPLSAIDYRTSYVIDTALMVAALVAALWLIRPMVRVVEEHFVPVLAVALTFAPAFRAVTAGQNTALTLLAVAAFWRALHDDRDVLAGICLGLLLVKPQLALVFIGLQLVSRRWKALGGVGLGAAGLWLASAVLAGPGWLSQWWSHAQHFAAIDARVNGSNAVSWVGSLQAAFGTSSLVAAAGWGLAGLTVLAVAWIWRSYPGRIPAGPAIGVAAAGALLISPHTMFYDAGLLVLTGVVLVDRLGRPGRWALAGAWVVALGQTWAGRLGVTPVAAVVVAMFMIAATEARRPTMSARIRTDRSMFDGPGRDLSIIIPAWNEAGRIGPTLARIAAQLREGDRDAEVIVVDDGSTDNTVTVIDRYRAALPNLRVISTPTNRGKGHAVRTGMLAAIGRRRLLMDADSSTDLSQLGRLEMAGGGASIVIGSIAVPGAEVTTPQSPTRVRAGRLGNLAVRLAVLPGIHDSQRGFKLFSAAAADDVFSRCRSDGWSFDVEALGLARVMGYEVVEVGVRWQHREASRVRPADYLATLVDLVRIQSRLVGLSPDGGGSLDPWPHHASDTRHGTVPNAVSTSMPSISSSV